MSFLVDTASWILLLAGAVFGIIGGVGTLRMPDFYTRLHAASITDTAGMTLMLAGLILQAGFTLVTAKLVFILMFLLITSPTATHALARAALTDGIRPLLDHDKRNKPDGDDPRSPRNRTSR